MDNIEELESQISWMEEDLADLKEQLREAKREKKIHIKIFITKSCKFRVEIKEYNKEPYQVTLGGHSWKNGVGKAHKGVIIKKCAVLVNQLKEELHNINKI